MEAPGLQGCWKAWSSRSVGVARRVRGQLLWPFARRAVISPPPPPEHGGHSAAHLSRENWGQWLVTKQPPPWRYGWAPTAYPPPSRPSTLRCTKVGLARSGPKLLVSGTPWLSLGDAEAQAGRGGPHEAGASA